MPICGFFVVFCRSPFGDLRNIGQWSQQRPLIQQSIRMSNLSPPPSATCKNKYEPTRRTPASGQRIQIPSHSLTSLVSTRIRNRFAQFANPYTSMERMGRRREKHLRIASWIGMRLKRYLGMMICPIKQRTGYPRILVIRVHVAR